ncbi:MAG: AAA-like domain-containing protein [Caldilineaceae bacterium]
MRFFNTAGPVNCAEHYCLPPLVRINFTEVAGLIAQKKYFILHAPRQVGKTSALLAMMDQLNRGDDYRCLYINVEAAQAVREDVDAAMRTILGELSLRAHDYLNDPYPGQATQDVLTTYGGAGALNAMLTLWARQSPKPLVLLIDEIDSLIGDTLIAVLRQLRAGYDKRPAGFPQSVVLCGVRNIQDYRIHSSREKAIITGGSAFNIRAESLRLGDFSREEMERLYQQHTAETGQPFTTDALEQLWYWTQGQPWLVNALGYELTFKMAAGRDHSQPLTADMVLEAKERLIMRRETHLDQLADKLREDRVKRVIEPILSGEGDPSLIPTDHIDYVRDLGLLKANARQLEIANPIYQEVIPRELTYSTQYTIVQEAAWYVGADGRLQMEKLLTAFQQFFREHAEHWIERFQYQEAGPQLLLQAFLQRIINGGGYIQREYGLGRRRTDLLILWRTPAGDFQRVVIETKLRRGSREATIEQGLPQVWGYMDQANADEGHLIIFDRTASPWAEKIFTQHRRHQGVAIQVWGM